MSNKTDTISRVCKYCEFVKLVSDPHSRPKYDCSLGGKYKQFHKHQNTGKCKEFRMEESCLEGVRLGLLRVR